MVKVNARFDVGPGLTATKKSPCERGSIGKATNRPMKSAYWAGVAAFVFVLEFALVFALALAFAAGSILTCCG
jgi:hypothetical protein